MKEIIDWSPSEDIYTKEGEINLHTRLHKMKFDANDFNKRNDRLEFIKKGEDILGRKINGKVLDVGCGNGYSSVDIARTRDIEQVHAMECDMPAVDKLIRANFENNKISEDKYELVLGSFNDIKNKDYYDFVISLGAIHHSGNLIRTMKSIYDALKPGGVFIAHEPYMSSSTPNSLYIEKEGKTKKVQNLIDIIESERDDHFFRECEYLTSFYHSGFDVHFQKVEDAGDNIFNALIVLVKPKNNPSKIPHAWF